MSAGKDFLNELGRQISSQFSLGENETRNLDAVIDGQNQKYGSFGDYAKKIDQSAERRYVEEGYLRKDPYNTTSKKFEVLVQEPTATVLLKKKMFSSIAQNFRPDFMDADEKLYYRAMQILFQNKCKTIAALEKLSKIQKVTEAVGQLDSQLVPIIITLADTLENGFDTGSNAFGTLGGSNAFAKESVSSFAKIIDRLRRVYAYNSAKGTTSWITDETNLFRSQIGNGTGVIEITNFTSINTTVSTSLGGGNFGLNITDPYQMMLITEYDIEKAIADASNSYYNHKSFQFGIEGADKIISDAKNQLNQARRARKASPITFKVNPDTLLGRRVTAIVDDAGQELLFSYDTSAGTIFPGIGGAGNSVTVRDEYLKGGAVLGFNGLDDSDNVRLGPDNNIRKLIPDSELSIFKRLVAGIYNKIQLEANSKNAFQITNKETNYVRRKLRFNFSGQLLIQPMDTVHIYMNSKSRYDSKLLTGVTNMFSGVGILQNLNNTVVGFENAASQLFNPSGNIPLQIEKSVYVGDTFPNFLWSLLRTQFVTEKEGTHVFGGVVTSADDNWSNGKFTISVQGKDNSYYFEQGKINFSPGIDNFNGSWFDPLTPFKSKFDQVEDNKSDLPELLDENKFLLGENGKSSLVRHKLGPMAGQKVKASNYIQDQSLDPTTGRLNKVFYAPDGLAYKWKEGIGVFTQFGRSLNLNDPNKTGNANTFAEPFAGLDIMNVLSLLITGVPYNFETYYKVTQNPNLIGDDPQSRQNAAHSYFNSLKNDLSKSNALWGNFIPFKNLVMDEQTYMKELNAQTRINESNRDLEAKLKQLSSLNTAAIMNAAGNVLLGSKGIDTERLTQIKADAINLQADINQIIESISKDDFNKNATNSTFDTKINSSEDRRFLRRQINYLTRRMSYEVRGNEDKNLFIVDDAYDKDYDIMAYNQALSDGIKQYNNEFTSVIERIRIVSSLLNLEVFCDTQGHIRVRSPQYNRMPSSTFYKMMFLKQSYGIQIFPEFLNDFFGSKLEGLRNKIEIIEDEIRLDCAILGHKEFITSDDDSVKFISSVPNGDNTFNFISDATGLITDIDTILFQANPDIKDQNLDNSFSEINKQANGKNTFINTQKYTVILNELSSQNLDRAGISTKNTSTLDSNVVTALMTRIQTKTGKKISPQDYIIINPEGVANLELPSGTTIDTFKVVTELFDKIEERQKSLKLFYQTIKNATEFKSLDDSKNITGELITPGIFGNSNIPEVYEHMIEDESYDDYGIGSGKRYVIKNSQIKSLKIAAVPPEYTAIEVQGTLNTLDPKSLPPGLSSFPGGGNGMTTAMAIDYDMWRNYGFKQISPISVPFLSDPVSQCGPYANILLSRNRQNILQGSLTIVGNEFMQPGEVIFLEDRNLLFYVNSVKHTMDIGRSFSTSLELTYGHTPGQYIPTVMDSIGKMIYKNREIGDTIIQRQDNSNNEISIGIVQRYRQNNTISDSTTQSASQQLSNDSVTTDVAQKENISNLFHKNDVKSINNILYTSGRIINSNNSVGNNVEAKVQLRVYYDDNTPSNQDTLALAKIVKQILEGDRDDLDSALGNAKNPTLNKGTSSRPIVEIIEVNMDQDEQYSPSQKAIDMARTQIQGSNTVINLKSDIVKANDKLRSSLFNYIIDCWIKIEPVEEKK
jgi:hypothetical protein